MKQLGHFKRRILRHYDNATEEQYTSGLHWYREAYEFCVGVSKRFGVPLEKTIGILAALSPNNKWARNKIDLELFLENPSLKTKVCTFMGQREKALEIYKLTNWQYDMSEYILDILRGTKTKSFFSNILEHKTSQQVVIDLWMFRSCEVEPKTKYINDITQAVLEVSEELELRPHQLQAIVWAVARGSHE